MGFNHTEQAFAYKKNWELVRDYTIYSLMRYDFLVKSGIVVANSMIRFGFKLPLTMGVRPTVFPLFVGGKSLKGAMPKINQLYQYNISTILDYGVEGKGDEEDFEHTAQAIKEAIIFASEHDEVEIVSSKFTSLIPFSILERLHRNKDLNEDDREIFRACKKRIESIAALAYEKGVPLYIDAEESWIQRPLDEMTIDLMRKYNKEKVIIYNTIQLYLQHRLKEYEKQVELAKQEGFLYGAKLVRGAYLEKEAEYANRNNLKNPIQVSKSYTDKAFDTAVAFSLQNIEHVAVSIATHNENSILKAIDYARKLKLPREHAHIHFAQLLGMSDHISFNLAKDGWRVSKYMPYGPVKEVLPYLIRRAQENSSVSDQIGRELQLHKQEMKRRKLLF